MPITKSTKPIANRLRRVLALIVLTLIESSCYSRQTLWLPSDDSQNNRLVTSFSGEIAASVSIHSRAEVRMSIFDSLSQGIEVRDVFGVLDSHLIKSGGEDSVMTYERKYKGICDDSWDIYTHKLMISKNSLKYLPERSLYIKYGCEYTDERMIIDEIKETDSSLLIHGHMSNRPKDYPMWIEVLPKNKTSQIYQ